MCKHCNCYLGILQQLICNPIATQIIFSFLLIGLKPGQEMKNQLRLYRNYTTEYMLRIRLYAYVLTLENTYLLRMLK